MPPSGTSLVEKLLEQFGMLLSKKRDKHQEAVLVQDLNLWLMYQSSSAWDNPEPIQQFLSNPDFRELAPDYIAFILRTPCATSLIGLLRYIRYRTPASLDIPWGWRDPRSTFTLPV